LVAIENAAKKGHYAIKTGYNELNQAVIDHLKSLGYKVNMESSNDPREESYMLILWQ
jgi:ribosomal protein S8